MPTAISILRWGSEHGCHLNQQPFVSQLLHSVPETAQDHIIGLSLSVVQGKWRHLSPVYLSGEMSTLPACICWDLLVWGIFGTRTKQDVPHSCGNLPSIKLTAGQHRPWGAKVSQQHYDLLPHSPSFFLSRDITCTGVKDRLGLWLTKQRSGKRALKRGSQGQVAE